MENFILSAEQKRFFETFGYLVFPGLFAGEIQRIKAEFDHLLEAHKKDVIDWKHQAHRNYMRLALPQFIDRSEYLSGFIDDPRVKHIFTGLLGDDFDYRGSDANVFEHSTVWHSDTYGALFKYLNVKLVFYLDEIDENTGCFRMIPGSHHFGDRYSGALGKFLEGGDSFRKDLGLDDIDIPCVAVPTKPGDVVAFDFRLKHATCYGEGQAVAKRKMFTICASERIADEDVPKLRDEIRLAASYGYRSYYGEAMVKTANAQRMVHLEQCLAQDDCLNT